MGAEINPNRSFRFQGAFRFNEISITKEDGEKVSYEKYSLRGNYNFEYNNLFVFYNDDPYVILDFNNQLTVTDIRMNITKINEDEFKVSMIDNVTNEMKKLIEKQETHHQELSLCKEEILNLNKNSADLIQYNAELNHCNLELNRHNEEMVLKNNDLMVQLEDLNLLVGKLNKLNDATNSLNEQLSQDILNYKKQLEEKNENYKKYMDRDHGDTYLKSKK